MRNNLWKIVFTVSVIILFIGTSVCPSIAGFDEDIEKPDYSHCAT